MHRQHYRFAGYSRLEIAFMLVLGIFIGLLAVTKYLELSTAAKEAMEPGLIEGVRSGIAAYAEEAKSRGNSKLFPSTLDDAASGAATPRDPFFGRVLEKGVAVEGWSKLERNHYLTPSGNTIVYHPESGEFLYSSDTGSSMPVAPDKP